MKKISSCNAFLVQPELSFNIYDYLRKDLKLSRHKHLQSGIRETSEQQVPDRNRATLFALIRKQIRKQIRILVKANFTKIHINRFTSPAVHLCGLYTLQNSQQDLNIYVVFD